jgi:hypothetical protein
LKLERADDFCEIAELNEQLKQHRNEVSQLREAMRDHIDHRERHIFEFEHMLIALLDMTAAAARQEREI